MLEKMKRYEQRCRELCSDAEFVILKKAFFEKDINLIQYSVKRTKPFCNKVAKTEFSPVQNDFRRKDKNIFISK
jgi:hypothetical protein